MSTKDQGKKSLFPEGRDNFRGWSLWSCGKSCPQRSGAAPVIFLPSFSLPLLQSKATSCPTNHFSSTSAHLQFASDWGWGQQQPDLA